MRLFKKMNSKGFSHVEAVIAILVVVGIAAVGVRVISGSHAATPPTNGTLSDGQTLTAGQSITALPDQYDGNGYGSTTLTMQTDGNLVEYTKAGIPIWQTHTNGTGSNNRLVMQTDGNLVVYTSANKPVWSSSTSGTGSYNRLVVQSDGNLVVYTSSDKAVWNSGTAAANGETIPQFNPSWPVWYYNTPLIVHNVGSTCPVNWYGTSQTWWCSNSSSSNLLWYGPGYTLPYKLIDMFQYGFNFAFVNSSGQMINGWPSGASFTYTASENNNTNIIDTGTLNSTNGSYYCKSNSGTTGCVQFNHVITNEPLTGLEINISNVNVPAGVRLGISTTFVASYHS